MLPVALPDTLPATVRDALLAPLVDHHCHGVRRDDLTRARFELLIDEGGTPAPPGTTHFDSPLGLGLRRWCAPLLDLEPHTPPAVYLARRAELGAAEVNRRLLAGAGVVAFLVDTGSEDLDLLSAAEMGRHGGAAADENVRIEQIEQDIAESAQIAVDYLDGLAEELAARAARAVGLKTVIGLRCGLGFDPARPSTGSVIACANRRLADPKQ
ncbi:MAG: amidohydrolase, partial [Nonomuraea sp.]|nr:amidohydrolase [Nonomuraea sp.]